MTTSQPRVAVIGGGVMGAAAAWQIARRGGEVTLIEQFEPAHPHGGSHGSSRIFRLAHADPVYVDLAARAQSLWRDLEAATGSAVLTLTGAVDHGPAEVTEVLAKTLLDRGHAAELLSPADAGRRWPGLRFDTSVLHHPEAGRVHADDAVLALWRAAERAGATLRPGVRIDGIESRGDGVRVISRHLAPVEADVVVLATGSWLPGYFGRTLPLPPIRVTQEQPAHFAALSPGSALTAWPSFIHHPGAGIADGIYGLGSADGVKIGLHAVGPVVDPDHRDPRPVAAALAPLVDYARAWLPGVSTEHPIAQTCLYDVTPDHDFIVDRLGPVVLLGGFSGHGFKHAPAIGELAAQLVLEGAAPPPRLALARFR